MEAELRVLRDVSLSGIEGLRLMALLGTYVRGFAMMQVGTEEERNHPTEEQAFASAVAQLRPAKFPTLLAATDVGAVMSVSDDSFDSGLRQLVTGMARSLNAPGTSMDGRLLSLDPSSDCR
jgi:hypothetical protein